MISNNFIRPVIVGFNKSYIDGFKVIDVMSLFPILQHHCQHCSHFWYCFRSHSIQEGCCLYNGLFSLRKLRVPCTKFGLTASK